MTGAAAAPGEICNLKHEDYDSAKKEITYRRDSGVRYIVIDSSTAGILDQYITWKEILPSGFINDVPVFFRRQELKEGLDIREIQRFFGHSHPYLTQRFMFFLSESEKK